MGLSSLESTRKVRNTGRISERIRISIRREGGGSSSAVRVQEARVDEVHFQDACVPEESLGVFAFCASH